MRISDWSSDVCSSDIQAGGDRRYPFARGELARIGGVETPAVRGLRPVERAQDEFGGVGGRAAGGDAKPARLHAPSLPPFVATLEIGRASCRASVWRSLAISVVAVSLKKTTHPT